MKLDTWMNHLTNELNIEDKNRLFSFINWQGSKRKCKNKIKKNLTFQE